MKWAGRVARIGRRIVYRVLVGNLRKTDQLEGPGIVERIILRWIFKEYDVESFWIDLAQNRDRLHAFVIATVFFHPAVYCIDN
jgi:hypothetical protein